MSLEHELRRLYERAQDAPWPGERDAYGRFLRRKARRGRTMAAAVALALLLVVGVVGVAPRILPRQDDIRPITPRGNVVQVPDAGFQLVVPRNWTVSRRLTRRASRSVGTAPPSVVGGQEQVLQAMRQILAELQPITNTMPVSGARIPAETRLLLGTGGSGRTAWELWIEPLGSEGPGIGLHFPWRQQQRPSTGVGWEPLSGYALQRTATQTSASCLSWAPRSKAVLVSGVARDDVVAVQIQLWGRAPCTWPPSEPTSRSHWSPSPPPPLPAGTKLHRIVAYDASGRQISKESSNHGREALCRQSHAREPVQPLGVVGSQAGGADRGRTRSGSSAAQASAYAAPPEWPMTANCSMPSASATPATSAATDARSRPGRALIRRSRAGRTTPSGCRGGRRPGTGARAARQRSACRGARTPPGGPWHRRPRRRTRAACARRPPQGRSASPPAEHTE
jgi:hypothetical protein